MPNQQVMEQWVEALESGRYAQTTGALWRTADNGDDSSEKAGYCCLGVLCDLAVNEGVIPQPDIAFERDKGMIATFGDSDTFLPEAVKEWAGLDEANPWVDYEKFGYDRADNLAMLNDEELLSFEEIADIVRLNFFAKPDAGQPA